MAASILIIEDNADNMTLMDYLLRAGGYSPALASGGALGLRIVAELHPELVVLDVQMPEMDGYEVVAAIRRSAARPRPVIVAVTAFAMVGDQDRIIASGFDGYLTKPISPERFVGELEQFLPPERRLARRPLARSSM